MKSAFRRLVKWSYVLFALLLIGLAAMVQTGRSFSHLVTDYREPIVDYLSTRLNARVSIGSLEAQWDGLRPTLAVADLRIANQQDEELIRLNNAQVRFDILQSLLSRQFVWHSLLFNNVELAFIQQVDGKWKVQGVSSGAASSSIAKGKKPKESLNVDQLLDMLLLSNRIEFVDTRLRFEFLKGNPFVLQSPSLLLENGDDFHRLRVSVDMGDTHDNVKLVIEGQGDPRDRENFRSAGYLEINGLPTQEALNATSDFLFHGLENQFLQGDGDIQAKIWLNTLPDGQGYELSGNLGLQRIQLAVGPTDIQLDDVTTDLTGRWQFNDVWSLSLLHLQSKFGESNLSEVNINLAYQKETSELGVTFDQINLHQLNNLLTASGALGKGRLRDIITEINPIGSLRSLQANIPLHEPESWRVRGELDNLSIDHWRGVPRLRALDGYVEANKFTGGVWIDSGDAFTMQFIPTYAEPMAFDRARGHVAWHVRRDENRVYVNSGALKFTDDATSLVGYMLVDLPLKQDEDDEHRVDLTLQISADNLPLKHYKTYVPAIVADSLSQWLDEAVGENNEGVANHVGMIYRGDLTDKAVDARTFSLFIDANNASLNYHPRWPALSALSAHVLIQDGDVDATAWRGQLRDTALTQANMQLRPHEKGSVLRVLGATSGPANDMLRTVREGQLRDYIGGNMDSWRLDGQALTQLDLQLVLGAKDDQFAKDHTHFLIGSTLSDATLELRNLNLTFSELSGNLSYQDDIGFTDTTLQGVLFDHPVTARLSGGQSDDNRVTKIAVKGRATTDQLAAWSKRPEVLFLSGDLDFNADIDLIHRAQSADKSQLINAQLPQTSEKFAQSAFAKVAVESNLKGVVVNLPNSLYKPANKKSHLSFEMWMQESASQIEVNYDDRLHVLVHTSRENDALINASIGLNQAAEFASAPEFLVKGKLPAFDLELWQSTLAQYMEFQKRFSGSELDASESFDPVRKVAGLPLRAQVELAEHAIGPLRLQDVWVEVVPIPYGWGLKVENPLIAGRVQLPDSQFLPMQIDLDYLYLPANALSASSVSEPEGLPENTQINSESVNEAEVAEQGEAEKSSSVLSATDLPAARVRVANLHLGEELLGPWQLEIKPQSQGVVIDDIQGAIRGLRFAGNDSLSQKGARLIWSEQSGIAQSRFIGSVSASNMADVSKAWNIPALLESEAAQYDVDLRWDGTPSAISLVGLQGEMNLQLTKGRFYRNAGAGDGILRLMSVINFDSIVRRLRLDFSDLYQSGLAFDSIEGQVHFQKGVMQFTRPLDLRGPSSRLQLAGTVDLNKEEINSRLIATLPVAGNLTFAAALITGLPAAVGVYVVSKLFKKQVDRATSISYEISGSWDEPVVRFTRFFESEENLSKLNSSSSAETGTSSSVASQIDVGAESSSAAADDVADVELLNRLIEEGQREERSTQE